MDAWLVDVQFGLGHTELGWLDRHLGLSVLELDWLDGNLTGRHNWFGNVGMDLRLLN